MKKLAAVVVLGIALWPANALAAFCFSIGTHGTVLLELAGGGGKYVQMIGEMIRLSGEDATVVGSAHLRSNGTARIGLFISGTTLLVPLIFEGTLDPPSFISGSGELTTLNSDPGDSNVAVSSVACPPPASTAVPQSEDSFDLERRR